MHSFLVKTLGRAHGGLDGQRAHVLPALLQQGDEVVDGQHDVTNQLILGHANVANGDTHAEHLLQLELDGRLDFGHLVGEVLVVGDRRRELSGLGETRTEETGDLLDQGVRGDECIVLASKLLDELLVLVEFLQILRGNQHMYMVCGYSIEVRLTSVLMASTPWCLARSMSCWSPSTHKAIPTCVIVSNCALTIFIAGLTYGAWVRWEA
jgi:hypothetical protein